MDHIKNPPFGGFFYEGLIHGVREAYAFGGFAGFPLWQRDFPGYRKEPSDAFPGSFELPQSVWGNPARIRNRKSLLPGGLIPRVQWPAEAGGPLVRGSTFL